MVSFDGSTAIPDPCVMYRNGKEVGSIGADWFDRMSLDALARIARRMGADQVITTTISPDCTYSIGLGVSNDARK